MKMTVDDIAEQVEKMLPCLFPDEFKSKLEHADKQTIKNLLAAHKNENFQKVLEGCRTRSRTRHQKILRAVELAFESDLGNDECQFDANQNRHMLQPDVKLDISKSESMLCDIPCSPSKYSKYESIVCFII